MNKEELSKFEIEIKINNDYIHKIIQRFKKMPMIYIGETYEDYKKRLLKYLDEGVENKQ